MAGYTKDFLVDAFLSRYWHILDKQAPSERVAYIKMTNNLYDKVGKDKFRVYASLDAAAIREYKASKVKPMSWSEAIQVLTA